MPFSADLPCIETPRLLLRPFVRADAPVVRQLAGAREIADTTLLIPHPYPEGAAEQWISTHADDWKARRGLALAITVRGGGELVGAIGLTFSEEHSRGELGYWVGLPYWRNGFATEATTALIDFAFRALGLNRVQAHHFARNPASGRVLLKAGLHREGASPRALRKHGRFEDVVFYGILRRDWPGLRGSAAPFPG